MTDLYEEFGVRPSSAKVKPAQEGDLYDEFGAKPQAQGQELGFVDAYPRGVAKAVGEAGRFFGRIPAALSIPVDAASSAIGLTEPGTITDALARLLVSPSERNVEFGRLRQGEKLDTAGMVGYGLGNFVGMAPEIAAGGPGRNAAIRLMERVPTAASVGGRVVQQAVPEVVTAIPSAAARGTSRAEELVDQGVPSMDAGIAGAINAAMNPLGFAMPAAIPGRLLTRAASGAVGNVVQDAATTGAENFVLPPQVRGEFLGPESITSAALGAVFGAASGNNPARFQTPADLEGFRAAADLEAERVAGIRQGYERHAAVLQANGVAPDDPRVPQLVAMLDARAQKQAEAQAERTAVMSPEERDIAAAQRPPETIVVAPEPSRTAQSGRDAERRPLLADIATAERLLETGELSDAQRRYLERRVIDLRAQLADEAPAPDAGPVEMDGTRAGVLAAGGVEVKADKRAREAFDIAGATVDPDTGIEGQRKRKQHAADEANMTGQERDLRDASAGGTTSPEGSAATAPERFMFLDVQRDARGNVTGTGPQVTVLRDDLSVMRGNTEVPAAEISYELPDGTSVTQVVQLSRLTELSRPANPRFAQDVAAQSYSPPRGVGTGEQQPTPLNAAQRITTDPPAELERPAPPRSESTAMAAAGDTIEGQATRIPDPPPPPNFPRVQDRRPRPPAGTRQIEVDPEREVGPNAFGDAESRPADETIKRPARGPEPIVGVGPEARPVVAPDGERRAADVVQRRRDAEELARLERTDPKDRTAEESWRLRELRERNLRDTVDPERPPQQPAQRVEPVTERQPRERTRYGNDTPRTVDPAVAKRRKMERTQVEVEVREAETGQTYKVKISAAEAVADVDSRLEKARALWECLNA